MTTAPDPTQWFEDFDGRAWLNTSHQGALPRAAADAAHEAVVWKTRPSRLTSQRFQEVPDRLRDVLGRLLNVPAEDVVLANSASYGLHLIANAFPWRRGDEVLVMDGDFPSGILPWLTLERRLGVKTRRIRPRNKVVQPSELADAVTPRTRLLCVPWVHSFSGYALDLDGLGAVCRERGIVFIVNASQGLGTRPLDLEVTPVDGLVSVGFKWLCGPYGTGLLWLRPDLRSRLNRIKAYWLASQTADDLASTGGRLELPSPGGTREFDIFGTANFFNFTAWTASLELLLGMGVDAIAARNQDLVSRLVSGLPADYRLLSPETGANRSTLVFVSHHRPEANANVHACLTEEGIDTAHRAGCIRFSPHLYNTVEHVDRALRVLDSFDPEE